MTDDEAKSLASRLLLSITIPCEFISTWLPYLIRPEFDNETPLRNNVFCIFHYELWDIADGGIDRINDIERTAKRLNAPAAIHYVELSKYIVELVVDALRVYTKEQSILLDEIRYRITHGHIHEMMKNTRTIRYIGQRGPTREKVSAKEFNRATEAYFKAERGYEKVLSELRRPMYQHKTQLWILARFFQDQHVLSTIISDVQEGKISGILEKPNSPAEFRQSQENGLSLFDFHEHNKATKWAANTDHIMLDPSNMAPI